METAYLFAFFTTKTGDFLLNETPEVQQAVIVHLMQAHY